MSPKRHNSYSIRETVMGGSGRTNYTLTKPTISDKHHRLKPIQDYSTRERAFITDTLHSADRDQNITGTRVVYVEPEGSDQHLSLISSDDEDPEFTADAANIEPETNDGIEHLSQRRPGKFKKAAKKLYPAKVVGGAKAIGGAIRHPMVTTRKVNKFVRRKENSNSTRGNVLSPERPQSLIETMPALSRSLTVGLVNTHPESSPTRSQRKRVLRRRNSAPLALKDLSGGFLDTNSSEIDKLAPRSSVNLTGADLNKAETEPAIAPIRLSGRSNSDAGLPDNFPPVFAGFEFPSPPVESQEQNSQIQFSADYDAASSEMMSEIQDQIQSWNISGYCRASQDTASTVALSYKPASATHKKADSEATIRNSENGKTYTDSEELYLKFVLDELYHLITATALDKSGIQYRNTFAWKFHTEKVNEFDRAVGYNFTHNGKRFRIKDFINCFDFGRALLEKLSEERSHRELGLRWSEVSFVDRRMKIELSYTLSDDESE